MCSASHPSNRHRPQSEGAIHCHRHRGSAASYGPASYHTRPRIDDLYTEYCTTGFCLRQQNRTAPSHQRQRHVDQPLVSTLRSNRTSYTVSHSRKEKKKKQWPRPVRPSPTSKIATATSGYTSAATRHQVPPGGLEHRCLSTATHRDENSQYQPIQKKNTRPHREPPSWRQAL